MEESKPLAYCYNWVSGLAMLQPSEYWGNLVQFQGKKQQGLGIGGEKPEKIHVSPAR